MTRRSTLINGKRGWRGSTSSRENVSMQAQSFISAEERLSTEEGAPSFMRGKERSNAPENDSIGRNTDCAASPAQSAGAVSAPTFARRPFLIYGAAIRIAPKALKT